MTAMLRKKQQFKKKNYHLNHKSMVKAEYMLRDHSKNIYAIIGQIILNNLNSMSSQDTFLEEDSSHITKFCTKEDWRKNKFSKLVVK